MSSPSQEGGKPQTASEAPSARAAKPEPGRRATPLGRRRSDRELRDSEEHFRLLFDQAPTGMAIHDLAGRYRRVNRAFCQTVGRRAEELLATRFQDITHPDDRAAGEALDRRLLAEGLPFAELEKRYLRPDGAVVHALLRVAVLRDPGGQPPQLIAQVVDITERKQAELLQQSERRFRRLVENLPRGAAYIEGESIFVNKAAEEITGYSRHQITTLDQWFRALYGEEHRTIRRQYERDREAGFPTSRTVHIRRRDGRLRQVEFAAYEDDQCQIWVLHDVTDRRRAQEALRRSEAQLRQAQKMEAIGTLAGGVAHDFNNILTAITGYTHLALAKVAADSRAGYNLRQVLTAGKRARDLVSQILTFGRRGEGERGPVSLEEIVREASTLLRATLPAGIVIEHDLRTAASALPTDTIHGDATQIQQVLMNLGTNAGHAMRETGGTLSVSLEETAVTPQIAVCHPALRAGRRYLRLVVRDTGDGIPAGVKERIFEPFFTTKKIGEGTGLGLAVVHGIVADHGGAIAVESAEGQGTSFEIFLPRVDAAATPQAEPEGPPPTGDERVLLIDDEEAVVEIYHEYLTSLGYRVEPRTDSRQAYEDFRAAPWSFDLVITDQAMPGMTGETLAGKLLAVRPELPIVLCTGFSHTVSREQALAAGIRAYLMKPFEPRELAETVRSVLA